MTLSVVAWVAGYLFLGALLGAVAARVAKEPEDDWAGYTLTCSIFWPLVVLLSVASGLASLLVRRR